MKYRVHCYAVVRVPLWVEADSHKAAMEKASETNFEELLNHKEDEIEYAEEISHYLVDEEGDEEYDRSQFYNANMEPYVEIAEGRG